MKRYLFEYRYDGAEYGCDILAESEAEARARIKAIAWAQYRGEVAAKIPVPGGRWLARGWRFIMGARS